MPLTPLSPPSPDPAPDAAGHSSAVGRAPGRRRWGRALAAGTAGGALVAGLLTAPAALADPGDLTPLGTASELGVDVPVQDELLDGSAEAIPGRWFVQVAGDPVLQGGSARANTTTQEQVQRRAADVSIDLEVERSFTGGWNGMTVSMSDADVAALRGVAGVEAVFPVLAVEAPEPAATSPEDAPANAMTGADVLQEVEGLSGDGVRVAIIDSGIDYNHPDLGGSGTDDETADFPNDRVVGGYDYVGDAYDSSTGVPAEPDAFPDDCGGHGTHVAGIVGADGEVTGVAPAADLLAYRIFGCDGTSDTDVILAAMEQARADGADVVNMSLGASFMTWPDYPTAQMADSLVDSGITVVISAGNSGTSGTFSSGAPGVAASAITVASVDSTHRRSPYATAAGADVAYSAATGAPTPPTAGELALVAAGAPGTPQARACDPTGVAPAEAGQALLVERGTCSFREKALAGEAAGYEAVILYDNAPGVVNPTVEGDPALTIPVVMLGQADGLALQEALAAGEVTWAWQEGTTVVENETAGLVSDFSSYGLTADLQLKPDVAAPGGSIWSTVPLEQGAHGAKSGTSMAAPHVAGAAALLLEKSPDLSPADVKAAMMSTADPLTWSLVPDQGYLEPVHRQGAGMLDLVAAASTTARVAEPSISLGEGEDGPSSVTVTVENTSAEDVTYTVGVRHGVATGAPTLDPAFYAAEGIAEPAAEELTVPAGGSADLEVTLGEDFGEDGIIYGGWITLTAPDADLVVPFAGLSGDYQALPVLEEVGLGLPALGVSDGAGGVLIDADGGHEYTMQDGDVPYLAYHLAYPVETFEVRAYQLNGGGKPKPVNPSVGSVLSVDHLGRTAAPEVWAWDGTYALKNEKTKTVKNGTYQLELRVLKPLGDPANPDHWEIVRTPTFTIANPTPGKPGAH
ncbi:S8 family serine peptidase [Brachybacterium sp. J144]|uniref:S8 family serine peptidase n=1 Tax=Brachybacterium sp. J144 TaxID=3116487 RepID=UPI002E779081|nr:S8 family serine peptidase [Brachybacterium sp. J144]MEE1651620.1 S8 family serine peptidase [Brachybacterium sp. J144]